MKVELQQIGNGQAVFIPDSFLIDCGITKALNLRLDNHRIIIEPLKTPRAGWFENYQAEKDIDIWEQFSPESDCEEWEW